MRTGSDFSPVNVGWLDRFYRIWWESMKNWLAGNAAGVDYVVLREYVITIVVW